MSLDLLLWVIRAVIIVVAIILAIIIWKGRKKGRYQKYSLRFLTIGITAFIMGVVLLLVSLITDLSFDYGLYLITAGVIGIIIGLVVRNIWERTINTSTHPQTSLTSYISAPSPTTPNLPRSFRVR
ncbi:hypothetical protein ACFLS8_04395 [Chloroflexota bacterium]